MLSLRIIPVLLLKEDFFIKYGSLKYHKYVGDALNTVKLFNDLKVDELIFLDSEAPKRGSITPIDFVPKEYPFYI